MRAVRTVRAAIGADLGGTKMAVGRRRRGPERPSSRHRAELRRSSSTSCSRRSSASCGRRSRRARTPRRSASASRARSTASAGFAISSVNLPIVDVPDPRPDRRPARPARVYIDNDANVAALAEHRFGAAKGHAQRASCSRSAPGSAAASILDGELYRGTTGAGAELGHMVIDQDGPAVPGQLPEPRLRRGPRLGHGARARGPARGRDPPRLGARPGACRAARRSTGKAGHRRGRRRRRDRGRGGRDDRPPPRCRALEPRQHLRARRDRDRRRRRRRRRAAARAGAREMRARARCRR